MKRFFSFITVLVGVVLIIIGVYLSQLGNTSWILSGAGIFLTMLGFLQYAFSGLRRKRKDEDLNIEETEEAKVLPEYRRKSTVLSRHEWNFLQVLKGIVNPELYDLAVQVPLVAVIDKVTQTSYRNELFRVIDFLIVDNITYAPILLIELNDSSHKRADRMLRDAKVKEICARANMPMVVFESFEAKDSIFVKKVLSKYIKRK